MALPNPIDDVYIMIDDKDIRGRLFKKVVVARYYQRNAYNDFILNIEINSGDVREYEPEPGIKFMLGYTDKNDAPYYPPDADEHVVLVDFIRELDGPTSIMSTNRFFLEYYKNILNSHRWSTAVYIIIDDKDIRGQSVKRVVPAKPYQRDAYNNFTTSTSKTETKILKRYYVAEGVTFQLKYDDRMNTYDSYIENGYVLVDFIRDNNGTNPRTTSYMSTNKLLLMGLAGFINRMMDGLVGGGRKLTRRHRKLTRRHRKLTRRHRKSTPRRRRKY